jgi:ABC-type transporter MlaC component
LAIAGGRVARVVGILLTTCVLTLASITPRAEEDMPGPRERLERAVSVVVVLLEDASLDPEARWQSIAAIVFDRFDFQTMARSVMAGAWNEVGVEERLDFVEYFARYVVEVYRVRIEGRSAERVEYVAERIDGDRASVETVIVAGDVEIPVTYRERAGGESKHSDTFARQARTAWMMFKAICRKRFLTTVPAESRHPEPELAGPR